jgi:protein-S-isoprenylcysteine O-methyltransferase Ste14
VNLLEVISHAPLLTQPPLAIAVDVIVFVAVLVVTIAIVADFMSYHKQSRGVKADDRSLVETGSMTAFFIVYYAAVRFRLLEVPIAGTVRVVMIVVGLLLLIAGVVVNVLGRFALGPNWANQIKIYEGHTLKTTGPYAFVRHPLYASLIAIFVGGSLVYSNALSLALTVGVFVPMMVIRARKEEVLLLKAFSLRYEEYQARTGMLFPRPRRR